MDVNFVSVFYRHLPSVAFPRTRAGKRPWARRNRGRECTPAFCVGRGVRAEAGL